MSQQFNEVKVGNTSRSTFDLSHHQVTTGDFGYLIPICVRDLVPNDDFVVTPNVFCRLAPLAVPTYGRITCRVHSFFVPYRILYPHWAEFITQSPANNTIPPFFTVGVLRQALNLDPQFGGDSGLDRGIYGRVMANLGINPEVILNTSGLNANDRISAFRWLAYYRIWLDWFMDSNINDHATMVADFNNVIKDGGSMVTRATDFLRYRNTCFGKDYFTTAKLHPQSSQDPSRVPVDIATNLNSKISANTSYNTLQLTPSGGVKSSNNSGDGSNPVIGEFTVEELRAAVSLQRYLERNNYVGTKVINQLLAHFGIAPTPERLDMSEFIGGSNFGVQIGDVTSTSNLSPFGPGESALGSQAGKGIAASRTETVRYHAKEHGVFMTLLSILPDTAYYQGIPKVMQLGVTGDPLDFYTPEFENLGFQEILNKEVYVPSAGDEGNYNSYDPDGIFGYAPRYAFLKWQQDILAGDMLGSQPSSGQEPMFAKTDSWHLFRKLYYDDENPLVLNDNFVECDNHNTDYDRVFQFTDSQFDHFYFNIDVDVKATRPMVGFAEPTLDSVSAEDGNKVNLPYGGTRL